MEEQFVLRVPPSLAEQLNRALVEEEGNSRQELEISLEFEGDGRTGVFGVGGQKLRATLVDLPCVVESFKTYDGNVLIKTADIGQMILVQEPETPAPEGTEYPHGLTPPLRDARRRRFRRDPDVDPEVVSRVEEDLQRILDGGTAKDVNLEVVEGDDDDEEEDGGPKEDAMEEKPSTKMSRGKGKAK